MLYSKCVGHLLKLQCKDFLTTQNAYTFYQVVGVQSSGFLKHYLQSYRKISLTRRNLQYGICLVYLQNKVGHVVSQWLRH
jgi:hypothetical protein